MQSPVLAARFTATKVWKRPACASAGARIKEVWSARALEYYSALKKKAVLQYVTTWMNLLDTMLNEMCQPQQDKYCTQHALYEVSIMVKLREQKSRMVVARVRGAEMESH